MDKTSLTISYFLVILCTISCFDFDNTDDRVCPLCVLRKNCLNFQTYKPKERLKILKDKPCGFEGIEPKICCPPQRPTIEPLQDQSIVFTDNATDRVLVKPRPSAAPISTPEEATREYITTEAVRLKPSTRTTSAAEETTKLEPTTTKAFPADPFPSRNICGQIPRINDRIYGGQNADIDDYPWLARVKYETSNGKESFACSASLITDRYLVTAAHCLSNKRANPISVRLGEWDEETRIDCQNNRCTDEPVDIRINKTIIHPEFQITNQVYADVALILLEKLVNFTDFISPICLPTTDYVKMQDYVKETSYWTAGWGITEYGEVSPIKRKLNLNVVPSDICTTIYPDIPAETFSQLICAGGRKGKDSCRGDSGGPLMREVREEDQINLYLFGITSSGSAKCGSEGYPGFYTRVSKYMEWIQAKIRNG